jgi:ribulose-phosphate 3-epimerase
MQLDVMDGVFVDNHSLDFDMIIPPGRYEAHLMVIDPLAWINKYGRDVETILVHIETISGVYARPDVSVDGFINTAKQMDKRIGFAINPETSLDAVVPYLSMIDELIVMTVVPGKYGSPFIPEMLDKVRDARKLNQTLDIEVDGGISDKTISQAYEAGANLFISGSYIMRSDDIPGRINYLDTLIKSPEKLDRS